MDELIEDDDVSCMKVKWIRSIVDVFSFFILVLLLVFFLLVIGRRGWGVVVKFEIIEDGNL